MNSKKCIFCLVYPNSPEVDDAKVLLFGMDSALVTVQWSYQDGISYDVDTIPQINTTFIERTRIQMLICYNTVYNVSITATLCGQNGVTTTVMLNYGKLIQHSLHGT